MMFPPVTPEQAAQGKEIAELVAALPSPLPRISVAEAAQAFVELHRRYNQFRSYLPSDVRRDYLDPHFDTLTAFFAVPTELAKVDATQTVENT